MARSPNRGAVRRARIAKLINQNNEYDEYLTLISQLHGLAIHSNHSKRSRIGRKGNKHRDRAWGEARINELSDKHFTRMFRLDRVAFNDLLQKISTILSEKNEQKAIYSSGSCINNFCRLAMTLRWLAGASYLDLCQLYQVDSSTFYAEDGILWPTMEAINQAVPLKFPTNDPNDPNYNPDELAQVASDFSTFSNNFFTSLVGAIDGLVIRTRCPFRTEVTNQREYRNRKGCFGVLCLGVSDIRGKFLSFSCNWTGSTHDSHAWNTSSLYYKFFYNKIRGFHLIGDEAFSNTDFLLSPWPGRSIGVWKDSFNYQLSHSRQCIERAFGMLVQRFGVLQRRLIVSKRRWSLVAVVCAKLHNICIDRNIQHLPRLFEDVHREDDMQPIFNDNNDTDRAARATGTLRSRLTQALELMRKRRPQFASCNSRA